MVLVQDAADAAKLRGHVHREVVQRGDVVMLRRLLLLLLRLLISATIYSCHCGCCYGLLVLLFLLLVLLLLLLLLLMPLALAQFEAPRLSALRAAAAHALHNITELWY